MTRLTHRSARHPSQPELPAHIRLALSVIERAVRDIKGYDASLYKSAAKFLNGSKEFRFWTHVLEQDSTWLLRTLHATLRKDSPRAFERLSPDTRALSTTGNPRVGCSPELPSQLSRPTVLKIH